MTVRVLVPGLALLLAVLSGHAAPGQDRPRQPNRPAAEPAPRTEVRIFTLRNADAGEMVKTLRELFTDSKALRVALHASTNSVLATGSVEDLDRVNTVVTRLDDTAGADKKGADKPKREEKGAEEAKQKLALAEADAEQARERAAWADRMTKLGYMTAAQAAAEQARLREAYLKLVTARQEEAQVKLQVAPQAAQDKPKPAAGAAWEYKVQDLGIDRWEATLNKAGEDGWELVGTIQQVRNGFSSSNTLIFKRPKR